MNKAFIREPDDSGQRNCPRCGALGLPVGRDAVATHLRSERQQSVGEPAFFCSTPTCDVAYFDLFERTATTAALTGPVYPKDPTAPVCACFGLTRDEIEDAARSGDLTKVRQTIARARLAEAQCAVLSPQGRSCVAEVQRCFMKARFPEPGK